MSDQFSEWDKFYRQYERLEDENEAFDRYRQSRKRRGTLPKTLNPQQRMQMEYEMRVEKRRVEALKEHADDLARESASRASKNTTRD